jgi:1-acyl-sn-glycerol-3-phosphate acyltransferase
MVFFITVTPWKRVWHFKPEKGRPVVYAANHSSYLDIPSLCLSVPFYFVFVGKSSLGLYIAVDRNSKKSQYKTLIDMKHHIDNKRSIAIFPEGTIPRENNPSMIEFKDGPFRIAIEKQVPLVPVTIPYNWYILPDNGSKSFISWHLMKIVFHKPIETKGMTADDIERLKNMTYNIIHEELQKSNPGLKLKNNSSNFEITHNSKVEHESR